MKTCLPIGFCIEAQPDAVRLLCFNGWPVVNLNAGSCHGPDSEAKRKRGFGGGGHMEGDLQRGEGGDAPPQQASHGDWLAGSLLAPRWGGHRGSDVGGAFIAPSQIRLHTRSSSHPPPTAGAKSGANLLLESPFSVTYPGVANFENP